MNKKQHNCIKNKNIPPTLQQQAHRHILAVSYGPINWHLVAIFTATKCWKSKNKSRYYLNCLPSVSCHSLLFAGQNSNARVIKIMINDATVIGRRVIEAQWFTFSTPFHFDLKSVWMVELKSHKICGTFLFLSVDDN